MSRLPSVTSPVCTGGDVPHVGGEHDASFVNGAYVTATIKEETTEVNDPLIQMAPFQIMEIRQSNTRSHSLNYSMIWKYL